MYLTAMAHAPSSPPPAGLRWDARLWGALIVLCGVLFLDGLDVSMVGVALPSISEDLDLTTAQLQWIVSGYVLGYGGLLLLAAAGAPTGGGGPGGGGAPPPRTPPPSGAGGGGDACCCGPSPCSPRPR